MEQSLIIRVLNYLMSKPKSIQLWPDHDLRISAHYQLSANRLINKTVEENQVSKEILSGAPDFR